MTNLQLHWLRKWHLSVLQVLPAVGLFVDVDITIVRLWIIEHDNSLSSSFVNEVQSCASCIMYNFRTALSQLKKTKAIFNFVVSVQGSVNSCPGNKSHLYS